MGYLIHQLFFFLSGFSSNSSLSHRLKKSSLKVVTFTILFPQSSSHNMKKKIIKWFGKFASQFNRYNNRQMENTKIDSVALSQPVATPPLAESILNYLNMKTTGALLLTGDWGSGKTYHLKNTIFPLIEKETKFIPIMVSLYGEAVKHNIASKVLLAFLDKKSQDVKISAGTIAKNLKHLAENLPIVKKYVDLEKLFMGSGENVFRLLPHDKLLICFDDIERMSDKLKVDDFLGIINELVENKGCKVLLVANEEEIKGGIAFKEKTIEKTIHFVPNISEIFDSIVSTYPKDKYQSYLKSEKGFFIKTLSLSPEEEKENKELKKAFSNIRTLKFALEHFRIPFELLTYEKEFDNTILTELHNIWIFTLSISIEFRKPNNITFTDRKKLDVTSNFSNLSLADLDLTKSKTKKKDQEENEWTYSEHFKEIYYKRLLEIYIFYPDLYDLITSGKEIHRENFLSLVNQSFKVKEGKINPAHEILNTLMKTGYAAFTNERFEEVIRQLLNYCENGKIEDVVSYLNAGVYLLGFNDILGIDPDTIVLKIKAGLSTFLSTVKWTEFTKSQFDMVRTHFNTEHLQQLIRFIDEKVKEFETTESAKEIRELQQLFSTDINSFVQYLWPNDTHFRTPNKPQFHLFDQNHVQNSVVHWQPEGVINLTALLKFRYLDTGFAERLTDEIVFLDSLQAGISKIDFSKSTLSKHLLRTQLQPIIVQSKNRLNQYKTIQPNG